jgi:hypothetical protein
LDRDKLEAICQELDDAHNLRHVPAIKDAQTKSLSAFSSNRRT